MQIFSLAKNIGERLSIVAGALFGSQIPEFIQQYTQRLAGHVDELQKMVNQLQGMAALSHKSLEQYIQKFRDNADPDFVQQGNFMEGLVLRLGELKGALVHLTEGSAWMRSFYFFKELQSDIAQSTYHAFQMGINFSAEGLFFACGGMVLGWAIYRFLWRCCINATKLFKQPQRH